MAATVPISRCFMARFLNNKAASLGLKRCHGGSIANGVEWKPCEHLERCLGMPQDDWQKRSPYANGH